MRQNGFFAEVIKTDIIKVDESSHGLPPNNGAYAEFKVADYFCPDEWSNDGVFISVKEGDPLWFNFQGNSDECAILCAVQRVNPVTGEPADLDEGLTKDPTQNYLRMPEQLWLDGYAKEGKVYQFVVTKAGIGLAVNEYVLPKHMQDSHAVGFAFFGPKNPKPKPTYTTREYPYKHSMFPPMQHWKIGSSGGTVSSPGNIMDAGGECLVAGNDIDACVVGNEPAQVFCCSSIDETCSPTIDVTRGRKSAHDTAVTEADAIEIDTINILANQEADLTDLDKASMGAGGRIAQSIVTDSNTTDYYHEKRSALLTIYFALPEMYDAIMKKGKRQDASKKDKFRTSGHIGGTAVPLITQGDQ